MNTQSLIGFTLESCSFSKGSYTFEVSGLKENVYITYFLSTTSNVASNSIKPTDLGSELSPHIWSLLERRIVNVSFQDETTGASVNFIFDNGKELFVWADEDLNDNLILIQESGSKNWCTLL